MGGAFDREETWKNRIDAILAEGADAIDVGPESTRAGATPVDSATQVARALEPVRYALSKGAIVSIDTTDAAVAEACLSGAAHAVNDVSCGAHKELALVAAKYRAAYVLMHSRPHHGTPGCIDPCGFTLQRRCRNDRSRMELRFCEGYRRRGGGKWHLL